MIFETDGGNIHAAASSVMGDGRMEAAVSHIEKPGERDSHKAVPIAITPHRLIAAEVPFEMSPSPQDILNILQYVQGEQGRCALGTYHNTSSKLCNGRSDLLLHVLPLRFYYNRNLIAPDLQSNIHYAQ